MMTNSQGSNNLSQVEDILKSAEEMLKQSIEISLKEINSNPAKEKELISLWAGYATDISNYFIREAEKNGNDQIGKNIIKHFMFKR